MFTHGIIDRIRNLRNFDAETAWNRMKENGSNVTTDKSSDIE